jgi:hypothetical protein
MKNNQNTNKDHDKRQQTKRNWYEMVKLWGLPVFKQFIWLELEHRRLQEHAYHP